MAEQRLGKEIHLVQKYEWSEIRAMMALAIAPQFTWLAVSLNCKSKPI
jgi:hypothetical protein